MRARCRSGPTSITSVNGRNRDLPALVGGWDVGLMPFVLNASTGFINPTKALEYMAAGRPIVSTPIHDVAELYGDIVYVGMAPKLPDGVRACAHRVRCRT
jgi:hypothetical protein